MSFLTVAVGNGRNAAASLSSLCLYKYIGGTKWDGGTLALRSNKNASLGVPPQQTPVVRKWDGGMVSWAFHRQVSILPSKRPITKIKTDN